MAFGQRRFRGVVVLLAAGLLALGTPAVATAIAIGGQDLSSTYTASSGIISFGSGAARGSVDTEDILGGNCASGLLCGGLAKFDVLLDLSGGYNPATDKTTDAVFLSAGNGPDLAFYEPGDDSTVALGFSVNFIWVTQVITENPSNPGGTIVLGTSTVNAISSRLVLTSGTANAAIGLGSEAWLRVTLPSLSPALTQRGGPGYLNADFASGIALPTQPTTWDLVVVPIPEPGTAVLLGLGLLTIVATARRSVRR